MQKSIYICCRIDEIFRWTENRTKLTQYFKAADTIIVGRMIVFDKTRFVDDRRHMIVIDRRQQLFTEDMAFADNRQQPTEDNPV